MSQPVRISRTIINNSRENEGIIEEKETGEKDDERDNGRKGKGGEEERDGSRIGILERLLSSRGKKGHCSAGTTVASRSVSAKIPLRTRLTASRASSAGKLPKWQYRQAFRNRSFPRPQRGRMLSRGGSCLAA